MKGTIDKHSDGLNLLLSILRSEAEGQEKISMSRVGLRVFEIPHQSGNTKRRGEKENRVPIALNLLTGDKQSRMSPCVFCSRLHDSKNCFQVQKMSLQEKKDAMKKKKARYLCLRQGHRSAECKTNLKCLICGKRHSVKMCADLPVNNRKGKGDLKEGQEAKRPTKRSTAILKTFCFKSYSQNLKHRSVKGL
jgi:hypothetical protein